MQQEISFVVFIIGTWVFQAAVTSRRLYMGFWLYVGVWIPDLNTLAH